MPLPLLATLHPHWLHTLPEWLFCLIVTSSFVAFAVGGQVAIRPLVLRWLGGRDFNEVVGHYLSGQRLIVKP